MNEDECNCPGPCDWDGRERDVNEDVLAAAALAAQPSPASPDTEGGADRG